MEPMTRPFVHLHCHSHYSLLDGAGSIKKLVKRAKDHGMNALALTDHGNLHGALEFYRAAKGAGIRPIIGYEAYIEGLICLSGCVSSEFSSALLSGEGASSREFKQAIEVSQWFHKLFGDRY